MSYACIRTLCIIHNFFVSFTDYHASTEAFKSLVKLTASPKKRKETLSQVLLSVKVSDIHVH